MTGRPAETWRKFNFRTPPAWTYALLVLVCIGLIGIIVFGIVVSLVSARASGHLPMTRSSRRLADLGLWVPIVLIFGSFALWTGQVVAATANLDAGDANAGSFGAVLFLVGFLMILGGLVGRLVVTPLIVPRARVSEQPGYYDKLVELRNVHPAFVAAVQQQHAERLARST